MNKLLKAVVFDGQLTLSVLETTDMINKAIEIHSLSPVAAASLGRTLTATTFMSSNLKSESDKLSVTIVGDGVGGKITVCGNGKLQMRGTVDNPQADLPPKSNGKLDVGGFVGHNGRLTVTRSMGLKNQYQGSSKLVSGEIAEDFTEYYAHSEQIPTGIALGVKIDKNCKCIGAGGLILQALPYAEDENLKKAEEIISKLKDISSQIQELHAEGLLKKYFGEISYTEFHPQYKCLCSKKYIENVLRGIGKQEVEKMIEEDGKIEVVCQFCNKKYNFYQEDIPTIFNK